MLSHVRIAVEEEFGWQRCEHGTAKLWFKGYVHGDGFDGESFCARADAFAANIASGNIKKICQFLRRLDGHFALCITTPDGVIAAVDRVRSIPLAYASDGEKWMIDDQALRLRNRLGLGVKDIDPDSALAFAMSGYTIGARTLYCSMTHLLPGMFLLFRTGGMAPTVHRYAQYSPWRAAPRDRERLRKELAETTLGILEKLAAAASGRRILVPLSAGLDSRLVVSGLARLGYRNVHCFSYGHANNFEAAAARKIAVQLGYPWTLVPFTHAYARNVFSSDRHREYHDFADNAAAVPVEQDFLALIKMEGAEWVTDDAIIVNGLSGDYITGAHIPPPLTRPFSFVGREERDAMVFGAIVAKHYGLWPNLQTRENLGRIKTMLWNELREAGAPFDNPETSFALYEFSEFQNRQCKYVIGSQRAYEFFGYEWRLPLWDKDYLEFWEKAPLTAKVDRNLFRAMLEEENWGGVWREWPIRQYLTPRWIVPLRFTVKATCAPLGKAFWHRMERRIFAYWTDHLCKYSAVPYRRVLMGKRSHRNAISWLCDDYLSRKGLPDYYFE